MPLTHNCLAAPPPQLVWLYTADSEATWLCPLPANLQLPDCVPQHRGCLPGSGAGGSLDILADLPLQALPALLQLLDGALLGELVGGAAELALSQGAAEQLLVEARKGQCGLALSPRGPPLQSLGRG